VKKLRWTPDVIYCSGWMAALVPLYVKKAYADTPFFENAKVIISLDDNEYKTPFGTKFVDKLLINGMLQSDVRSIAGLPVGYEDLMRLAIDYADALVMASPTVNQRLYNYAHNSGKIILPYSEGDERNAALLELCNTLCDKDDIE
jgi:starch synthase